MDILIGFHPPSDRVQEDTGRLAHVWFAVYSVQMLHTSILGNCTRVYVRLDGAILFGLLVCCGSIDLSQTFCLSDDATTILDSPNTDANIALHSFASNGDNQLHRWRCW